MSRRIARALAAAVAWVAVAAGAEAREWIADNRDSVLAFSAWRELPNGDERERFEAVFTVWRAEIGFDPEAPEAASLRVEIDVGSLNTGDGALNAEIAAEAWLAAGSHPTAVYVAEGFAPIGDGSYRADGLLTLRGVTAPVPLEFEIEIDGDRAEAVGAARVTRAEFDVGAHAGSGIAAPVAEVTFRLRARPRK